MTGQREPVDRDLLAETVRLFGMAIEYKGQVFNPAEVLVHTNGVSDLAKLQAAWTVMMRWQARNRGLEANRLFYEVTTALTMGIDLPPACACATWAVPDIRKIDLHALHHPACDGTGHRKEVDDGR